MRKLHLEAKVQFLLRLSDNGRRVGSSHILKVLLILKVLGLASDLIFMTACILLYGIRPYSYVR